LFLEKRDDMTLTSVKYILLLLIVSISPAIAQEAPNTELVEKDGQWAQAIVENGDTLLIMDLDEVNFTVPRTFKSIEDRNKYYKYKRYALVAYPYAVKAIKIFNETEYVTQNMKKKKRKKHIKRLQRELKDEFEAPLRKLTRTQGLLLMKMIEKETKRSMYDLLKGLRGGLTARYWQTLSRLYGYNLKDGYIIGNDTIMDIILEDLDVSYKLPVYED
jgi:hypothetical protein